MPATLFVPSADRETSPIEEVALLSRYQGEPAPFFTLLLESQCRLSRALASALLRVDGPSARVLVNAPAVREDAPQPGWLAVAMESAPALAERDRPSILPIDAIEDLDTAVRKPHLIFVPFQSEAGRRLVGVYLVDPPDQDALVRARERLELTCGLLALYDTHVKLRARDDVVLHLRTAMEVLEAVNEHDHIKPAAIALSNEIAARWQAERVSVGFLDRRYVKTMALSYVDRFDRKMKLVQAIESAMEECLDQDTEIIHPRLDAAIYVTRAAEELSLRHGPVSVASIPLRRHGRAVGVLCLERPVDAAPGMDEIEMLRLTCDLVTPHLLELRRRSRWIGARMADAGRELLAGLLGPRHTWKKLGVVGAVGLLLFLLLARGEDRINASFEISAIEHRVIPAPFDGRLESVLVKPGDVVTANETVVATLETAELQMELASARAEEATFIKEADLALRDGKAVEVQMAEANIRRVQSHIRLLQYRVEQATIRAPIGGTVVQGDLRRRLGAPLETGDVLFEIAQLDGLRAELHVPEDRIRDLVSDPDAASSAQGRLASVSHPGQHIAFEIEHVNPVAEVIDRQNVFRIRVRLLEQPDWLRPGMKGVAQVPVGHRSYASLWTRPLVSWLRMKLWM